MNLGQTMLSAAALVLLTVLVMNAHRMLVYSEDEAKKAEAMQIGVDLAQSLIDEIKSKRFDENALTGSETTADFTSAGSLGPGSDELFTPMPDVTMFKSIGKYDDADDYHMYSRTATINNISGFRLDVVVYYVRDDNPDIGVTYRTYTKKFDVTVSNATYFVPMTFSALSTFTAGP